MVGAWRAARAYCSRSCFPYHAAWRLFRHAGVKGNPTWHESFYRSLICGRAPWWPSRILVCGSSDETMPEVLSRIAPTAHVTVADACPAPLALIREWAHHAGTYVQTIHSAAPKLAEVGGAFDLVITDGLLSLMPDPHTRDEVIHRLASLVADDGLLLYTTRIAGPGGRLEYDAPGRVMQAAAALAWPAPPRERWRLARDKIARLSRPAPFTTPGQLADAFRTAFESVRVFTRPGPPTPALAAHPAFWAGRGSICVGVAALTPVKRRRT
ncbi:hypothetical protein Misp03_35630 [Microbispora sp. NBRC 16548]|nr:hypothetical protein Misp03_35630 [Microbispora sp. NBRC 16548]